MSADIEAEFIRACARNQVVTDGSAAIPSMSQEDVDWKRLLRLAARHGGIPTLYRVLSTTGSHLAPGTVLDELRNQHQAAVQHNGALTSELLSLVDFFRAEDLPVLSFKGPELAIAAYRDPTLRPFGDIDLLVKGQDVPRASALLESRGYRLKAEREWQLFFVTEAGVGVDLHWRLGAEWLPESGSFEDWWRRSRQVSVQGTGVTTLATEDLLLAMGILLTKDCMYRRQRLIQICDAAALLRNHSSLDWASLFERSRTTGTRRMLLFQLALAHEVLGVDLPAPVADSVRRDSSSESLARQVGARFFAEADEQWDTSHPRPGPGFAGHSFFLHLRERPADKLQYLRIVTPGLLRLAVTPTARDRALLPLPDLFRAFYYLVRPVRVLFRWLRTGHLVLD